MYDFTIIGGGVIGTLIARELSRYEGKVLLVDKENDLGNHATLANSAIIHSGHDPKPGTLKAKLAVEGNALYDQLAKDLDIPLLRTGAYVVAHDDEEINVLNDLIDRAKANSVNDYALLDGDTARKADPNISKTIKKVLSLPSTKVTYPWEIALAAMENALANGAEYRLNYEVKAITQTATHFILENQNGEKLTTHAIINAAGTFADLVAKMVESNVEYTITPRRGEYFVLDKQVKGFIKHILYPVPSNKGKGVLLVPQVHGNILLGPTSNFQDARETVGNHASDLEQIREDANRLADGIPYDLIIRTFAGLRATSTHDDFYIQASKTVKNFYHVAGIDSPGLTAAPAIARYVIDHLLQPKHTLTKKTHFNPIRKKPSVFHTLDKQSQHDLMKQNPLYGHIVCKCERISEAEIIDHINRPCGSSTIKGVKKRARAGSGLCQGGYCESDVLRIISEVKKIDKTRIDYYALNTPILREETKVKK